jgi:hypothetical protein
MSTEPYFPHIASMRQVHSLREMLAGNGWYRRQFECGTIATITPCQGLPRPYNNGYLVELYDSGGVGGAGLDHEQLVSIMQWGGNITKQQRVFFYVRDNAVLQLAALMTRLGHQFQLLKKAVE